MIFVDSNIPMHPGKDHPRKVESRRLVERLASERRRLVTSSEASRDLHRYLAADRRGEIELTFHTLRGIVDNVFSVREQDIFTAKDLTHAHPRLSSRDALHAAVMRRAHVTQILSFDQGFDLLPDIARIPRRSRGWLASRQRHFFARPIVTSSPCHMQIACDNVIRVASVQIRNVPNRLHRELKARAARSGMTLSDYLLAEIRENSPS